MELDPGEAIGLCQAAHRRLLATAAAIDDARARSPSRLPGWTVGHVVAHLANNAEGHVRRLEGALQGREIARYPGGSPQREADIAEWAGSPAQDLVRRLGHTAQALERVWERSMEAGWPHSGLLAGDRFPTSGSPLRRLREVEVHHVDLGLGYEPEDWPDRYVDWELGASLERLPARLRDTADTRRFLAWLTGRAAWPDDLRLAPWL
jgi:maleylpyruvate isomerase